MKLNEPFPHTACLLGMKVERTQAVVISYHPFFPDTSELIHLHTQFFNNWQLTKQSAPQNMCSGHTLFPVLQKIFHNNNFLWLLGEYYFLNLISYKLVP